MYKEIKSEKESFFSIMPKTTFIVMLLIMSCISTLYNMRKSIIINVDGKESNIITFRRDLKSTLIKQKIVLGPKDKITPNINSVLKSGDIIYIKSAVKIHILVGGIEKQIETSEETIEDMLITEGITISTLDKVEPLPTVSLKENMKVSIIRVKTQILKECKPIDFSTVIKKDDNLAIKVSKVVQEGHIGEKEITFRVIFEDGIEVSKKIIQEMVTKQPTEKVLLQGTLNIPTLSRGIEVGSKETFSVAIPQSLSYKGIVRCVSTAYSSDEPGMGTITSSGTTVKRNPNGTSTIATDPRVIPLGTRVYVEGYGYAIAEDTGGAIKGNKVDVYLSNTRDCINWGVRNVNVYILN